MRRSEKVAIAAIGVPYTALVVLLIMVLLAGCAGKPEPATIVRDRPVEVSMPLPQPCAGERPASVRPLKDQVPPAEWKQRDVRQKAALVGAQGLDRQAYGEQLDAATAACPPASDRP